MTDFEFFMAKNRRKATDEEMDRAEQELREYLRTPRDSWKQEPRWRRFFEIQKQHEEELEKYRTAKPEDKTKLFLPQR